MKHRLRPSLSHSENDLVRRLRVILLVEILAVFAVFVLVFGVINGIFTSQSKISEANLTRFKMALDVQSLESHLLKHINLERGYRLSPSDKKLEEIKETHQDYGTLLMSIEEQLNGTPELAASHLDLERQIVGTLEAQHADTMLVLSKLLGRPISDGHMQHTHTSSLALASTQDGLEAQLAEIETQSIEGTVKWRAIVEEDINRLTQLGDTYQRWRFIALFGQALVVIIIFSIVSYLYVLPAFLKIVDRIIRHNEQLKQIDTMKTEFLAVASHQLRTPLSELKWSLTLLTRAKSALEGTKLREQALNSVDSMTLIVSSLLNVSRIEQHRMQYQPKTMALIPVIKSSVAALKRKARDRHVSIVLHLPPHAAKVNADVLLIKQVLQNVINNGIQYNRPNGKVEIYLAKQGKEWKLTISDTGHGIPTADLKHMFTKFYRGASARKIRPDGSGLGLYFVKKIIEKHHGHITLESKVDVGTTVVITLPAV